MNDRLNVALEFLKEGKSFTVDDLRLGVDQFNNIEVTGWSLYRNLENLTKAKCLQELAEIKKIFSEMLLYSHPLKSFVAGKEISYFLHFDDGGKAALPICSESNNNISWCI